MSRVAERCEALSSGMSIDMFARTLIVGTDEPVINDWKVGSAIELRLMVTLPVLGIVAEEHPLRVTVEHIHRHNDGLTFKGKTDEGKYVLGHIFPTRPLADGSSWLTGWKEK